MSGRSVKQRVLALLEDKHLDLIKGDGYFYFVYDNPDQNIFETRSVYVSSITQLNDIQWAYEGHKLLEHCEKIIEDRKP